MLFITDINTYMYICPVSSTAQLCFNQTLLTNKWMKLDTWTTGKKQKAGFLEGSETFTLQTQPYPRKCSNSDTHSSSSVRQISGCRASFHLVSLSIALVRTFKNFAVNKWSNIRYAKWKNQLLNVLQGKFPQEFFFTAWNSDDVIFFPMVTQLVSAANSMSKENFHALVYW